MRSERGPGVVGLVAAGAAGWLLWRALRPRLDLTGRVVAITGGSRGLGLLLAREFGAHGARVAICARGIDELGSAAEELAAAGIEVHAMSCDVSDRRQVDAWISAVEQRFGRIDVLVNNASIIQVGPVAAMTAEDFERAMAVNFTGAMYATLAALPAMRERREGRIVNIASIGGKVAVPHLLPYDAAKFALVGFSEGLRAELARDGITVTTIVPGLMRTGSPPEGIFKGQKEAEYAMFSLASATPLTTMSATRAARRIVDAARTGEAEVTLTWQAKLMRVAAGLAPGVMTDVFGLVNRALPAHDGSTDAVKGGDLPVPFTGTPLESVLRWGVMRAPDDGGPEAAD